MFETNTCDNCTFHEEYFDETETGVIYHDGCLCCHPEAKKLASLGFISNVAIPRNLAHIK